ncbi:hypothetical protein A9Q74_12310 [Colwellia sp. 39_35_sub15_T18]|nr:hypothetical protein A9Q74_12310 [Colwellia sp. 39_35_sub15_T18]
MNMATRMKAFFASFTIKLFIWFWFIAIVSVASTRFISKQLSNEGFSNVVSQAPEHEELRQLHNVARRIERSGITSIAELQKMRHKRFAQMPVNIWFKSVNTPAQVTSLFLLPAKHQQALTTYLNQQEFIQPKTNIFSHTRLIGPVAIKINKQPYQVFISRKQHERNIGQMVLALPYWVRFTIPTLVSLVFCLLLAHSFSKPVRLIKKAATKLGQGDFATRVTLTSQRNNELGQLAQSFNQMAEQLQQHQSAQQRLLGDVSHELRSPMTRLQMALGLAQQEATTPQAREQYLQRCQLEIDRLDQMVADVLSLSRLENTLQTANFQPVNLSLLVQNIVNDEQFTADEKSINIYISIAEDIHLVADQNLLISAITNVLNNAVKYSPEQSIIKVDLSRHKNEITLAITDSGNGVPEQALTQLFAPFYRVNLARDRHTGGTGLGLAIAKQAILAHHGKIFAKNNSTQGLSVIIQIPYA